MNSSILFVFTLHALAAATLLLLALKSAEMAYHCFLLLRHTGNANRNISVDKLGDNWPITEAMERLHLKKAFRLHFLICATAFFGVFIDEPRWLFISGGIITLFSVWLVVLQALLSRLMLGYDDIYFRRISVTGKRNISENRSASKQQLIHDFVKFFGTLVFIIIIGYANTYFTLQKIYPGSFTASVKDFADFFYFSVVTLATVGYGDILPATKFARLLVVSEIFASMASLILLIMAYSITAQDNSKDQET